MTLERSLVDLETKLETAEKAHKIASAGLKKAKQQAKFGQLRDLGKSLAEVRQFAKQFADEVADADTSWKFDYESYFSSGDYLRELKSVAEAKGLTLTEKDGRIHCFPMLLTLSAKDAVVLVDRKPQRNVRPYELVKLLLSIQNRPRKSNEGKLLEAVFEAYCCLGPRYQKDWSRDAEGIAPAVPLVDIHTLLTLLPGLDREYPREEFARDIHILSAHPDLRTKNGRRFTLTASTGSKASGQRLTVVDQQGRETTYVGIRFQRE